MLGMIHGEAGEGAFWGMVRYGQVSVVLCFVLFYLYWFVKGATPLLIIPGSWRRRPVSTRHFDDTGRDRY